MDNNFNNFNEFAPAPAPVSNGKGFSIAALILSIISIIIAWIGVYLPFVALLCGILAIVFGVKGRKMSKAANGKASGLATAGLVMGIIGTCLAAIGTLCALCVILACAAA
ncbi:MAG: hypothetical protein IJW19_00790 [Clostridia bacterium]|nr:hypothetical protein [Clostridia bacterium]